MYEELTYHRYAVNDGAYPTLWSQVSGFDTVADAASRATDLLAENPMAIVVIWDTHQGIREIASAFQGKVNVPDQNVLEYWAAGVCMAHVISAAREAQERES
jgi:hypothetical protein